MILKRSRAKFFLFFGFAFPLIWYFQLWQMLVHTPALLYHNDFLIQYTAGRILNDHGGQALYDLEVQLAVQQEIIPGEQADLGLLPFNHPPMLVPFFGLLARLPYLTAFQVWAGVQLILWLAGLWIVKRYWLGQTERPGAQFLYLFALLLFYPAFISILKGQDSIVIYLAAIAWLAALGKGGYGLTGFLLAGTLLRPQITLALAVPLLFTQPKAWRSFALAAGVLAIYSLGLVGTRGAGDYLSILSATAQNSQAIINPQAGVNFTSLCLRLFPGMGPALTQSLRWVLYLGMILVLCLVSRKARGGGTLAGNPCQSVGLLAGFIPWVLFLSPYLHYHDLLLLLIPIIVYVGALRSAQKISMETAALAVAGMSLVLIFSELLPGHWRFWGVYLLFGFVLLGWFLVKNSKSRMVSE